MFGRIAAGLVHDLSHPIQNIGNSCKLIVQMFDDVEYRETFKRHGRARDALVIKRVLDDLRNIAQPIPLERFPVDVEPLGRRRRRIDAAAGGDGRRHAARRARARTARCVEGDLFALGRVYRNLMINAIQATAPGGLVVVAHRGDRAIASRFASTTPAAASPRTASARSSTTSSRPSGAASASASRSRRRSSSSSAARSRSRARSGRARPSSSTSRGPRRAGCSSSPADARPPGSKKRGPLARPRDRGRQGPIARTAAAPVTSGEGPRPSAAWRSAP